jgi:hypothetical protein
MAGQEKKKRGRPGRKIQPGERVPLSLRVTPETKARLDQASTASGRSQSQEAELRLERSFREEELLPQLIAAAFGERFAGILLALGWVMNGTGLQAAVSGRVYETPEAAGAFVRAARGGWIDDAEAFDVAVRAAGKLLSRFRPDGEESRGRSGNERDRIAEVFADAFLAETGSVGPREPHALIGRLLGPELLERAQESKS